jgi:hypothetical protein
MRPKKKRPTIQSLVREYFPKATPALIDWVVWEKTGYPSFWNIPKDGKTPEACFRKQLKEAAQELKTDPVFFRKTPR